MNSQPESAEITAAKQAQAFLEAYLSKDYELKVRYLSDHLQRMWTRFNFFVTIESALIGGKFLIQANIPTLPLAIAGVLSSVLWYVMGAQDRYLVELYRWQVGEAAKQIYEHRPGADPLPSLQQITEATLSATEHYVGRTDDQLIADFTAHLNQQVKAKTVSIPRDERVFLEQISSGRIEHFSTTHLAAFYPLIVTVLWLMLAILTLLGVKL